MVTAFAERGRRSRGHRAVCAADMQTTLRCLEGRWKMMILAHLFTEPVMRFSELQRAIPRVSQKMLIQQLRELERHDILRREVHPEVPPMVEYSLTDLGKALGPVFLALLDWAAFRAEVARSLGAAANAEVGRRDR
jgi:DNA-binding HxlR family transcriptional regulator